MNIKDYLKLLLKENNLNNIYNKFLLFSVITTLLSRAFYWILILFSEILKKKSNLITQLSIIMICIILFNVILKSILKKITGTLLKEIKIANTKYFNNKIKNIDKTNLLHIDLLNYYNKIYSLNDSLEQYILNSTNEYEILFYYITILIISFSRKNGLIFGIFIILYIVVRTLNELKMMKEKKIINESYIYNENIKNYFSNCKMFLINNQLNDNYIINNIENFEESKFKLYNLNNILDNHTNIIIFIFLIILVLTRIQNFNEFDFIYYFLILYDFEYLSNKITKYYNDNIINKLQEKLNFLNDIKCNFSNKQSIDLIPIKKITIHTLYNKTPTIKIYKPIVIENHILISGASGSGKTTLLYILKGLLQPTVLNVEPCINEINNQSYISTSNNKYLFNDYLYNIITNYDSNPNIELINIALKISKIDHLFTENKYINIQDLSNGEKIRLYISQIIYIVKTKNYNILLFDELDENLDKENALEICNNIKEFFKEKIILYVSNNKYIKKLFNKKIIVNDGLFKII